MAYAGAMEKIRAIVEAATPDTEAPRKFARVRGKASTAPDSGVAATSGAFRRFELVPGASRRGSAVNGTGAKQILHDLTLIVFYPDTADLAAFDTMEDDMNKLRSALEDVSNYDFENSSVQNIRVGVNTRVRKDGNIQLQVALTATYIGAN